MKVFFPGHIIKRVPGTACDSRLTSGFLYYVLACATPILDSTLWSHAHSRPPHLRASWWIIAGVSLFVVASRAQMVAHAGLAALRSPRRDRRSLYAIPRGGWFSLPSLLFSASSLARRLCWFRFS